MTTFTINTPATSSNAVLTMPTTSTFDKKDNVSKSLFAYSLEPKNSFRKAAPRFTSIDWDVNMNELEFE